MRHLLSRLSLPAAGALGALSGLAAGGCIDVPPPNEPRIIVRDLRAPPGTEIETACVPTGVERCFDARDDNCNGVIDEGCGIATGLLQFTIAWDVPEADVDLQVRDPSGETAEAGAMTSSGLTKDRDCPSAECQGQNVENVVLVDGDTPREPPRGRYRVAVRLEKLGGAAPPVRVRLAARVGQRTFALSLELSPGQGTSERIVEFTL